MKTSNKVYVNLSSNEKWILFQYWLYLNNQNFRGNLVYHEMIYPSLAITTDIELEPRIYIIDNIHKEEKTCPGIYRDETMAEKLMYNPNDDIQNYPFL